MNILGKLLSIYFTVSSVGFSNQAVINIGHGIELRPLKPDVHVVTYDNANALVAKMSSGEIVVVNTLYNSDAANTLLAWIKSRYKLVVSQSCGPFQGQLMRPIISLSISKIKNIIWRMYDYGWG